MTLIAIDPGLQGTGYAIWKTSKTPVTAGVLRASGGTWVQRADGIAMQVRNLVRHYDVDEMICEMMEMHQSATSQMIWRKGDLQRTLILIGTIHGMTRRRCPTFHLTPPSEWKGQLPKSVTIHRVKKALGVKACQQLNIRTHAWDAVGIGLWHMGVIT